MKIENIYINYKGEEMQFLDRNVYISENCEVVVNIDDQIYKFNINQEQANEIMKKVLECRPK